MPHPDHFKPPPTIGYQTYKFWQPLKYQKWGSFRISIMTTHDNYEGGPKNNENFFFISYISLNISKINHHQNTLLENQYTYPTAFSLFKTVLELLQSDSLQCLYRFFPHLLYILETLSFKVPLHSWKQEKITGCQVRGVGGGCEDVAILFFVRN